METSLLLVIVVGVVALVLLAAAVGAELDTEVQRRARGRVAEQRRLLRRDLVGPEPEELCARCPYRRPAP